jgi:hypothetical protein
VADNDTAVNPIRNSTFYWRAGVGALARRSDILVQLDDRFRPGALLLPSLCEARRPVVLGGGIGFSSL